MYAEKRKCTLKKSICTHGVIFFIILMEHRLGRDGIKNGPKIKIDQYFFVEIEKKIRKNQIKIAKGGVN